MIFEDVFYPGNPTRREEVTQQKAEIVQILTHYQNAWNEWVTKLNDACKSSSYEQLKNMTFLKLSKSVSGNSVQECVDEMKEVLVDTNSKMNQVAEDIGLDQYLNEDWKVNGIDLNKIGIDNTKKICDIVCEVVGSLAGVCMIGYIFLGAAVAGGIISVVTGVAVSLAVGGAALLAGAIVGGAAFIISDAICSAITGAIERNNLESAIHALTELKTQLQPLDRAAYKLDAMIIPGALIQIDDQYALRTDKEGHCKILKVG